MKVASAVTAMPDYSDRQPKNSTTLPVVLTPGSCNCDDSSTITAAAKEMFASQDSLSAPNKDHKSAYCIPLSPKDKMQILQLQALKRALLGKRIKIKAPCCFEEWQKQLREEDQPEKSPQENSKPCDCGCCQSARSVNVLT